MQTKKDPSVKGVSKNVKVPIGMDDPSTNLADCQACRVGDPAGLPEVGRAPARTASGAPAESCLKRYNSINGSLDSVGERLTGSGIGAEIGRAVNREIRLSEHRHSKRILRQEMGLRFEALGGDLDALAYETCDPAEYHENPEKARAETLKLLVPETSARLKRKYQIEQNIMEMVRLAAGAALGDTDDWQVRGVRNLAFLTLTFADNPSPEEAQRRWDILNTNFLRKWAGVNWVCVGEMQKRGVPHFHLVMRLPWDCRSGFDFSKPHPQKGMIEQGLDPRVWEFYRALKRALRSAGFGDMTHMQPVKGSASICKYVAKYIGKDDENALLSGVPWPKHSRRIRMSQGFRVVGAIGTFAWVNAGREWRLFLSRVAAVLDADEETFGRLVVPNWSYKLLQMMESNEDLDPREAAAKLSRLGPAWSSV